MTESVPVTFAVTANSTGKMRCELDVSLAEPKRARQESWTFATDEGEFHGGDGTAPAPLALFTGAIAACLVTQIRAFARRLRIEIRHVEITGRARWQLNLDGRNPYTTEPLGFELDVEIDSDASTGRLLELVDAAKKGCFIEQTLTRPNRVRHRLIHGGETIPIETNAVSDAATAERSHP